MIVRPEPPSAQYRPDIDGLRAVAILSVVCFHAFPGVLPGGFTGVDVFFVISGYLISTIILRELHGGGFQFARFYARRVRRLFPALIVVLSASMAGGWYLLVMDEFQELGRHILASSLFLQNFVLWGESNYFDRAAQLKPLLHLWSLAIEEQFYLVWPVLLVVGWKRGWSMSSLLSSVLLLSFGASLYLAWTDSIAAYYSPISRFWELAAGGGVACVVRQRPDLLRRFGELRSLVGLALVIAGFLLVDRTRSFPGAWALLSVSGTALVISAGSSAWLNRWVLGSRPMVWIGLISYPLYLWHWPLLSFLRIVVPDRGYQARLIAIAIAFLAAVLTYLFVEKPMRQRVKRAVALLFTATLLVMLAGAVILTGLLEPRRDVDIRLIRALQDWEFPKGFKPIEGASVTAYEARGQSSEVTLFVGDSHVEQYGPRVLSRVTGDTAEFNTAWFVTRAGCSPVPGMFREHEGSSECVRMRNFAWALAGNSRVRKIVIGSCWNCYFGPPQDGRDGAGGYYLNSRQGAIPLARPAGVNAALEGLRELLSAWDGKKKVYLLLDNPSALEFAPRHYIGDRFLQPVAKGMPRFIQPPRWQEDIRRRLQDIALESGAIVIDPASTLCGPLGCIASTQAGEPVYKDGDHLRPFFVRQEAGYIDAALRTADDP